MAIEHDIERIRSGVSIVAVVGERLELRKVGRNWAGLCPFHVEWTPSFVVREETGRFRCFGCHRAGDVVSFVQQIDDVDIDRAVRLLLARVPPGT